MVWASEVTGMRLASMSFALSAPVEQLVPSAVAMLGEDGVNVRLGHRQLCVMPSEGKPLRGLSPTAFTELAIIHVGVPSPDVHALHTVHMYRGLYYITVCTTS